MSRKTRKPWDEAKRWAQEIEYQQTRMVRLKNILRNHGVNVESLPNDPSEMLVTFGVDAKRAMRENWAWDEIEALAVAWATVDPRPHKFAKPTSAAGGGKAEVATERHRHEDAGLLDAAGCADKAVRKLYRSGHDRDEGEWTMAKSLKEIAQLLGLPETSARRRTIILKLRETGLIELSREQWSFRFDNLTTDVADAIKAVDDADRKASRRG